MALGPLCGEGSREFDGKESSGDVESFRHEILDGVCVFNDFVSCVDPL